MSRGYFTNIKVPSGIALRTMYEGMNDSEIIAITTEQGISTIFTINTRNNKWRKWTIKLPEFEKGTHFTSTVDTNHHVIYMIYGYRERNNNPYSRSRENRKLYKICISTERYEAFPIQANDYYRDKISYLTEDAEPERIRLVVVNGILNAFFYGMHWIWLPETKKFSLCSVLSENFSPYDMLYIQRKKYLFMVGSWVDYHPNDPFPDSAFGLYYKRMDEHIQNEDWITAEDGIYESWAFTRTHDEKFLIVLPETERNRETHVHYMDIDGLKLRKSSVKVPGNIYNNVVISKHTMTDQKMVNGYVRNLWKNKQRFRTMRYPPQYLIQIIVKFCQNEMLYAKQGNNIWKINVDDILCGSANNDTKGEESGYEGDSD